MPDVPVIYTPLQIALLEQFRQLCGFATLQEAAEHAEREAMAARKALASTEAAKPQDKPIYLIWSRKP